MSTSAQIERLTSVWVWRNVSILWDRMSVDAGPVSKENTAPMMLTNVRHMTRNA